MRNVRTAAVAAATALTVGLAGTSVATAQDTDVETGTQETTSSNLSSSAGGSSLSAIGHDQEAWQYDDEGNPVVENENLAYGTDMFGETQAEGPAWAENWKDGTIVAIIGSILGAIIGAVNLGKYTGLLPR